MASGGQILETKKQPEIVLLKYFYFPPENLPSRCHGFIPTSTFTYLLLVLVRTSRTMEKEVVLRFTAVFFFHFYHILLYKISNVIVCLIVCLKLCTTLMCYFRCSTRRCSCKVWSFPSVNRTDKIGRWNRVRFSNFYQITSS